MRHIKAAEVREGMEIEWKYGGYYTRCVVGLVQRENLSYPAYSIRAVGSSAGWKIFSEGEEVTVLKEPQPEEPTAFGACVEVAGVKYVRAGSDAWSWTADETPHEDASLCDWWCLTNQGHVTVINPDPFATVQAEPEPRVWDRWEYVPQMTAVHIGSSSLTYRKNMGVVEVSARNILWAKSSQPNGYIELSAPFTEVL